MRKKLVNVSCFLSKIMKVYEYMVMNNCSTKNKPYIHLLQEAGCLTNYVTIKRESIRENIWVVGH